MKKIYSLSGFLGRPADWDSFPEFIPIDGFENLDPESILVGYSMGSRRILRYIIEHPHHQAAVLISTHPGLKNDEERLIRANNDNDWARRFLSDSWDVLIKDWNAQSIFTDVPDRQERHYSRKQLSDDLIHFSLAQQPDLQHDIAQLDIPILWITGERDTKFTELANSITLKHPTSKKIVAPDAGHRVPWENETFFRKTLESFIGEIYGDANCTCNNLEHNQKIPRH